MKVRVRWSGGTQKLELGKEANLLALKELVAQRLAVSPGQIRLSLNKMTEVEGGDGQTLASLGICSGDLLYCLEDAGLLSSQVAAQDKPAAAEESSQLWRQAEQMDEESPNPARPATSVRCPWPVWLEKEVWNRGLGTPSFRLVATLHAALLDGGLKLHCPQVGPYGLPIRADQPVSGALKLLYGLRGTQVRATIALTALGSFLLASARGPKGTAVHAAQLPAKLGLAEAWLCVKDAIVLPLQQDLAAAASLPPPPCFAALPVEVKLRCLQDLQAKDLAAMAGVSREARQLAGEDALWEALVRRDLWGQPTRADKQTAQRRGWQALYQDLHRQKRLVGQRMGPPFHTMRYPQRVRGPAPFFNPLPGSVPGRIIGGDYDRLPYFPQGPGGLQTMGFKTGGRSYGLDHHLRH